MNAECFRFFFGNFFISQNSFTSSLVSLGTCQKSNFSLECSETYFAQNLKNNNKQVWLANILVRKAEGRSLGNLSSERKINSTCVVTYRILILFLLSKLYFPKFSYDGAEFLSVQVCGQPRKTNIKT